MSKFLLVIAVLFTWFMWFVLFGGIAAILILVVCHFDHTAFDSIWGVDTSVWVRENEGGIGSGGVIAIIIGVGMLGGQHVLIENPPDDE